MHVCLREVKNNPSDTLIYGISCDGSKNFNIRTCEHTILGQLTMGAHQTKNAPLHLQSSLVKTINGKPQLMSLLQQNSLCVNQNGDLSHISSG